jgi:NAD(P)-dependent dehydrogenase (short-subunit alcohol dehydrogenase family)
VTGLPKAAVPHGRARRILGSFLGQFRTSLRCPEAPRLDGHLAVVTGATGGIGLEIARGLARRGAELILPHRSPAKASPVLEDLRRRAERPIHGATLDLEDLESVTACALAIEGIAGGRCVDLLVENAGIWPQRYTRTRQGHEIAFGVNVLAHFALRRALQRSGRLQRGRVVIVTGDLYVLQSDCTPDFSWRGPIGGMRAYCRSKLGNLWMARELARREPGLMVLCAHPGVVATGLGGEAGVLGDGLKRRLMITPEQGAQTPLLCATQEGLESGGYYHNVYRRMRLPADDPALDVRRARALWQSCEALAP